MKPNPGIIFITIFVKKKSKKWKKKRSLHSMIIVQGTLGRLCSTYPSENQPLAILRIFVNRYIIIQIFIKNFTINFFPHSVRPFYRTVRTVCGLVGGQTLGHFMAHIYLTCFIYKLELGQDGADVKSWENQLYILY